MLFSYKVPLFDSLKTDKVKTTWTAEGDYFVADYKLNTNGVSRNYKGMLFYKVAYDGFYIDKKNGNVFQRRWLNHYDYTDEGGYSYNIETGNWDLSPTDTNTVIVGEYNAYTNAGCRIISYKNGKIDTLFSWINSDEELYRNQRGQYYFYALNDSICFTSYDATEVHGPNSYNLRIRNSINIKTKNKQDGGISNLGYMVVNNERNKIISSSTNPNPYNYNESHADTYTFYNFENTSGTHKVYIGDGSWFNCFIDDTLAAYKNVDSLLLYNYVDRKIEGKYYVKLNSVVNGLYQDSVHGISTFVLGTDQGKKLLSIHLKSKKVVMDSVITAPYFGKFLTTLADGSSLSIGNGSFLYKHNLNFLNFDTVTSNFTTTTIADNSIQFTDDSFGPITEWSWDFGDGGVSTLRNPEHKYSQSGTYQVTLKVVNEYGSEHSMTKPVLVEEKLNSVFDFGAFSGAVPFKVEFKNYSTPNAKRYIWNFGDGKFSYEKNPTHTFTATGEYTVSLTVFDKNEKFRTQLSEKKIIVTK